MTKTLKRWSMCATKIAHKKNVIGLGRTLEYSIKAKGIGFAPKIGCAELEKLKDALTMYNAEITGVDSRPVD